MRATSIQSFPGRPLEEMVLKLVFVPPDEQQIHGVLAILRQKQDQGIVHGFLWRQDVPGEKDGESTSEPSDRSAALRQQREKTEALLNALVSGERAVPLNEDEQRLLEPVLREYSLRRRWPQRVATEQNASFFVRAALGAVGYTLDHPGAEEQDTILSNAYYQLDLALALIEQGEAFFPSPPLPAEPIIEEETVLMLPGNTTLRSGGEQYALGAYIRFIDGQGREVVYWDKQEWIEAPEEVMGALLAILQNPQRLKEYQVAKGSRENTSHP